MQPEEARTVCILRRMKRKSVGSWAWNEYNPTKAQPEELLFDVLDGNERTTGQIAYDRFAVKFARIGDSVLRTPWGEGAIGWKDGWRIALRGRELFTLREPAMKKSIQLVSPSGPALTFRLIGGRRSDVEYADEKGFISVTEEEGRLNSPPAGRPLPLTGDELKALPKERRLRSTEILEYVQYRVKVSGALPVPQEDLVAALMMFASFGRLISEIPSN